MKKVQRQRVLLGWILLVGLFLFAGCDSEHRFVKRTAFKGANQIVITFAGPVDEPWAKKMDHYAVYEKQDPDILLSLAGVTLSQDKTTVTLTFQETLNQEQPHVLSVKEIQSQGKRRAPPF